MHLDTEIRKTTEKLRQLLQDKKNKVDINAKYNKKQVFKFKCTRCKKRNTKRDGTTTQIEKKARHFCFDCMRYFSISNDDMKKEINSQKSLSNFYKKHYLDKYLIKNKK